MRGYAGYLFFLFSLALPPPLHPLRLSVKLFALRDYLYLLNEAD